MKLTKEEQEIIKAHREKNQEDLPTKIGYLKKNIYKWWGPEDYAKRLNHSHDLSSQDLKDIISQFKAEFIEIKKGHKLYCYINNGIEEWGDEDGYFDCEDISWAAQFLEKIQFCKKPRA